MDIGRRKHPMTRRDTLRLTQLFSDNEQVSQTAPQFSKKHHKQTRQESISDWLRQDPRKHLLDQDLTCNEKYIFTAESLWRIAWDALILIFLVIQSFYIPFLIGFYVPIQGWLMYLDLIISIGFMLDILVSFNTAFYIRGNLVLNRREIAKRYIKSWFFIDLIASFPYEWAYRGSVLQDEEDLQYEDYHINKIPLLLRLIKIYRLFRMIKLIRLAKLKTIIIRIEDIIFNETLTSLFLYARLSSVVFFLAHWTACTWHFSAFHSADSVSRSWVLELESHNQYSVSILDKYITALYWSFTTMITIGYGDIIAHSSFEQITAMLTMCIASGFFSFLVGNLSNIIMANSEMEEIQSETMISVNRYMKKKQFPSRIQYQVRGYLKYIFQYQHKRDLREQQIFDLLNEPLREEILLCTHGMKLLQYRLFPKYFSPGVLAQITKLLKMSTFGPNDGVIEEGEIERVLYFIIDGKVTVYHSKSSTSLKALEKDQRFGEIGFFSGHPRTASVISVDFTELFYLDWKDMMTEFIKIPEAKGAAESIERQCMGGDYSELDIRCYLCKKKGHIVQVCNKLFQNVYESMAKSRWLVSRNSPSIKVNPHEICTPNYIRKQHHSKLPFKRPAIGLKKKSVEMFTDSKRLLHKAQQFKERSPGAVSESSVSSRMTLSISPERKRPHIDITSLYIESDEEEKELIISPIMRFDTGLLSPSGKAPVNRSAPQSPSSKLVKTLLPKQDEIPRGDSFNIQNSSENVLDNELQYSMNSSQEESFEISDEIEGTDDEYSIRTERNLLIIK